MLQDPYQPMMIRALPAQGPFCSRCFPPYKHLHRTRFPNNVIGNQRIGRDLYQSALQWHARQHGLSFLACANSSSVKPAVPFSSSSRKLLLLVSTLHFLAVVCFAVTTLGTEYCGGDRTDGLRRGTSHCSDGRCGRMNSILARSTLPTCSR